MHSKSSFYILIFIYLFCFAGCKNYRDYLTKARYYTNTKQFDNAIAEYDKVIKLKPCLDTAYYERAEATIKGSFYIKDGIVIYGAAQQSLKDYDKAILLNPNYLDAFEGRAFAKLQVEDMDGAYADYSRAIQLSSENFYNYYHRGDLELQKKNYTSALKDFDKAILLDSLFPNSYLFPRDQLFIVRAITKYELDMVSEAMEDFTEAYKRDTNHDDYSSIIIWMGYCKFKLNDTLGGCALWEELYLQGDTDAQVLMKKYCN